MTEQEAQEMTRRCVFQWVISGPTCAGWFKTAAEAFAFAADPVLYGDDITMKCTVGAGRTYKLRLIPVD